jgi:uncharacterized protein (DUF2252 family)
VSTTKAESESAETEPVSAKGPRGRPPSAVPHPTVAERVARGRTARADVPRSSHAVFAQPPHRTDPVDLLESQAESRVPELVPIRYGRMLVSPFTYYRGAALPMAADLASTPSSGLHVQLCGDAHLSNFGVFASPERRLVFDLNDFDETLAGPWEWDVKRLGASLAVAGRENGYSTKTRKAIVRGTVEAYRRAMREFAGMRNVDVWYARLEIEELMAQLGRQLKKPMRLRTEKALAKARTRDSTSALSKLCREVDGELRIASDPPLIESIQDLMPGADGEALTEELHELLRGYRQTLQADRRVLLEGFKMVDLARKVVGVGSVGSRAYIALLLGRDGTDPLFLQFKEAQPSVLERYLGKSQYKNHGERVVVGQHLMQASSDIFLGWLHVAQGMDNQEHDYYGRQLKDWKGSAEVERMVPEGMAAYSRLCGWTLARAHARSGDRISIAAYLGGGDQFDRAIAEFSEAYADQNERDYSALVGAVKAGRIKAQTGF